MTINVIWHTDAIEGYEAVVDYFQNEGFVTAAENFVKNVNEIVASISKFPGRGRPSSKRNIRYILVDKNRRMYYAYENDTLIILSFFNARQHPDKAPF